MFDINILTSCLEQLRLKPPEYCSEIIIEWDAIAIQQRDDRVPH
jgi:hypothetical protein